MFSRSKPSARGEEEELLGRTSHELGSRSAVSPTLTAPSYGPVSPQPTSPLSASMSHPHYLGSYETLGRRQSLSVNEKKPPLMVVDKPTENMPPMLNSPFNPGAAGSYPTVINDPFTGEPKATLSPDRDDAPDADWLMFEGCTADAGMQDRFWSHVAKIRELQSEVRQTTTSPSTLLNSSMLGGQDAHCHGIHWPTTTRASATQAKAKGQA
jgi:hypothetical protein